MTQKEYSAWMHNPCNIGNCENCPENRGVMDWNGDKPCGQQNCWVTCHIRAMEEAEADELV